MAKICRKWPSAGLHFHRCLCLALCSCSPRSRVTCSQPLHLATTGGTTDCTHARPNVMNRLSLKTKHSSRQSWTASGQRLALRPLSLGVCWALGRPAGKCMLLNQGPIHWCMQPWFKHSSSEASPACV